MLRKLFFSLDSFFIEACTLWRLLCWIAGSHVVWKCCWHWSPQAQPFVVIVYPSYHEMILMETFFSCSRNDITLITVKFIRLIKISSIFHELHFIPSSSLHSLFPPSFTLVSLKMWKCLMINSSSSSRFNSVDEANFRKFSPTKSWTSSLGKLLKREKLLLYFVLLLQKCLQSRRLQIYSRDSLTDGEHPQQCAKRFFI